MRLIIYGLNIFWGDFIMNDTVPCVASLLSLDPLTRGYGTCFFLRRAILGSTPLIATLVAYPQGMQLPKPVSLLSPLSIRREIKMETLLWHGRQVSEHLDILFGLGLA
jgi:hypothetical protein